MSTSCFVKICSLLFSFDYIPVYSILSNVALMCKLVGSIELILDCGSFFFDRILTLLNSSDINWLTKVRFRITTNYIHYHCGLNY